MLPMREGTGSLRLLLGGSLPFLSPLRGLAFPLVEWLLQVLMVPLVLHVTVGAAEATPVAATVAGSCALTAA